MKNIFIIGAGAIGKVLAVFLKLSGRNVVLLHGTVDDKSNCTEKIQVVLNNQSALEAEIEISTLSNFAELDGIIVLANKSYGNESLSRALRGKAKNSPIVILQNGLGTDNSFPLYRTLKNRETEIETLNFAIVDVAKTLNKENAVKETKLLGELIRLKSDLNGPN